jgi:adenosylcobinamide-GDP ribazoletransferase
MKSLLLALHFMTRLPLPTVSAETRDYETAIRWFPATGLVVGAAIAAAGWAGVHRDPWLGALLALIVWVGLTGALHLDGLGDIADAAGAAHGDPARLSAVLADPHIGSFGVVAIILQLVAKLLLLRLALDGPDLPALLLIPALARTGPIVWALTLKSLHQGMGSLFRAGASWRVFALWLLVLGPVLLVTNPAPIAALGAFPIWRWWLATRIGGISGDGHGAGIELAETAALAALVLIR